MRSDKEPRPKRLMQTFKKRRGTNAFSPTKALKRIKELIEEARHRPLKQWELEEFRRIAEEMARVEKCQKFVAKLYDFAMELTEEELQAVLLVPKI